MRRELITGGEAEAKMTRASFGRTRGCEIRRGRPGIGSGATPGPLRVTSIKARKAQGGVTSDQTKIPLMLCLRRQEAYVLMPQGGGGVDGGDRHGGAFQKNHLCQGRRFQN